MAEKDRISKTLESYNSVFADILNVLLFNGKIVVRPDELTPADTESQYKADGKIHGQERDVSKYWSHARFKIVFALENQEKPDKWMPLRLVGYDGASYRKQYDVQPKGEKGYPVITLVIYFGKKEWTYGKTLHSCLDIPPMLLPFVNDYKMNFYAVRDLTPEQIRQFQSDFQAIAEFFYALNTETDYHPTDKKLEHPNEVLDMISIFAGDDRFREEYNSMPDKIKEGGITMCEIYDTIHNEGRAEGVLKILLRQIKDGLLTLAQAAVYADMTVEEFEQAAAALQTES